MPKGNLVPVVWLDIADGLVQPLSAVSNPEGLRHAGHPGPLFLRE